MHPLNSLTLHYDQPEDRILLAVNAGRADACSFWLTRRLVLAIGERADPFLDKTSPLAGKTPTEYRADMAAMERQVALASTQKNISKTPNETLQQAAKGAELAVELTLSAVGEGVRMILRGRDGTEAGGVCSRADTQSIVHMIEQEAIKAGWKAGPAAPVAAQAEADAAERKKRAN